MERMNEIIEKYGEEYILRQLAEECAELIQAAVKLIRVWNKETPMREDEAREHLVEEIADVHLMASVVYGFVLNVDERECVNDTYDMKENRMYERLLDGKMEENIW